MSKVRLSLKLFSEIKNPVLTFILDSVQFSQKSNMLDSVEIKYEHVTSYSQRSLHINSGGKIHKNKTSGKMKLQY